MFALFANINLLTLDGLLLNKLNSESLEWDALPHARLSCLTASVINTVIDNSLFL